MNEKNTDSDLIGNMITHLPILIIGFILIPIIIPVTIALFIVVKESIFIIFQTLFL